MEEWLFNHNDFEVIYHKIINTEPNTSKSFFDIPLFDNRGISLNYIINIY